MALREEAARAQAERPAPTNGDWQGPIADQGGPARQRIAEGVQESTRRTSERARTNGRPAEPEPTAADDSGVIPNAEPWQALPAIDYTHSGIPVSPADATLEQRWAAVMAEVQEIRKEGRFSGGGANYNFRGIDAVVNAVGPAIRKHRVSIIPVDMTATYRDVEVGGKRTPMRECTLKVVYEIKGGGEVWTAVGQGESLDSGDKGTTKAGTVAYRNMLLTALSVPVDNPRLDADQTNYERSGRESVVAAMPTPQELANEALDPDVSMTRLDAIYGMVKPSGTHPNFGQATVENGNGDPVKLARLVWDIANERKGKS